jgi:hypothetical protein
MDAHALAGLYSCKIRSFDGYIQSLNPNLTYALIHAPSLTPSCRHVAHGSLMLAVWASLIV